jgi:hypothetical protein
MARYIFYTDQGYTISPNDNELENLQILGIDDGVDEKDATKNLLLNNSWIIETGFSLDKIKCKLIFNTNFNKDIQTLIDYLWEKEKKNFEENLSNDFENENHIFNALKNIKKVL